MFDLKGRVALVTGAGGGVGRVVARVLAQQGAAVALTDIDEEGLATAQAEVRDEGGECFSVSFDVTNNDACVEGIAAVEKALGPIDILVNVAGGTGGHWPIRFVDTPLDDCNFYVDINLFGTLNPTRAVIGGMTERGFGRVVSVSSEAARIGNVGSSVYGAAKAGVEGFSRSLAKEVARKGVTVNSIVLGLIDTVPPEFLEQANAAEAYAVGRVGTPEDVAAAVVYLVSEEASWVTGQSLVINGGGMQ